MTSIYRGPDGSLGMFVPQHVIPSGDLMAISYTRSSNEKPADSSEKLLILVLPLWHGLRHGYSVLMPSAFAAVVVACTDSRNESVAIASALDLAVSNEVLYIYDAIWAVAAAASRAAMESGGSDDGSGQEWVIDSKDIIPEMFSGPAFHGASGTVAFDNQTGYRRGLDLPLSLDNMVFIGETYEVVTVGTVLVPSESDTTIIDMRTGSSPLEWPDGSTYPQVGSICYAWLMRNGKYWT